MFNEKEQQLQNGQLFNGIDVVSKIFTLKSLEFFDKIAMNSETSFANEDTESPTKTFHDESHDVEAKNSIEKEPVNKIKCEVCGKSFNTRSQKWYHRKKFEQGTGCNIRISLGRPKKRSELIAKSTVKERRTEKIESKLAKVITQAF